jgi:hypothetical protein
MLWFLSRRIIRLPFCVVQSCLSVDSNWLLYSTGEIPARLCYSAADTLEAMRQHRSMRAGSLPVMPMPLHQSACSESSFCVLLRLPAVCGRPLEVGVIILDRFMLNFSRAAGSPQGEAKRPDRQNLLFYRYSGVSCVSLSPMNHPS